MILAFISVNSFACGNATNFYDIYSRLAKEKNAAFYSLPNSGHSYSELNDEGKEFVITTMIDFIGER
ncbi:MAG: hypothetical protein J6O61_15120 [Butyrivibrio sp.]|uniref:hypothetical protein n=1 Tax=Butyrivibrio sp. TaxID=28121 RepID=UPI001B13734D|nr:hypothetical protein [Butyrivibrio sp.]MBO6242134.1 hypothetical protein [Butyrivibrio sp.]